MSPRTLREYAEQLREVADRLAYHRVRTPEYLARLAAVARTAEHSEPDPR